MESIAESLFWKPVCVQDMSGLWGYIDIDGSYVIEPRYQEASSFDENGLAAVMDANSGLYGYIDTSGNYVIEPQFLAAYNFSQGLAVVQNSDQLAGYIDTSGNYVIAPQFKTATSFYEDHAFVRLSGTDDFSGAWAIIDTNGNLLTEKIFYPDAANNGDSVYCPSGTYRVRILNREGYFYINTQGEIIAPKNGDGFLGAYYFGDGYGSVRDGATNLCGYIDSNGDWAIPPKFYNADSFRDSYAAAGDPDKGGLWGIIDKSGNWVVSPAYLSVDISYGKALVGNSENYQLIDMAGNVLEEYDFGETVRATTHLWSDVIKVERSASGTFNSYCQFYNLDGSLLIDASFDDNPRSSYSESGFRYAMVGSNGLFGVFDKDGNWLIPMNYLDIKL